MSKVFPILVLILLALPFLALAALVPCGTEVSAEGEVLNPCTLCDFFVLIDRAITLILEVSIPIAVGVMTYGGILLVSAGGSEDRLKKGKSAILSALIGLFLVFAAWLIVDFILGNLLDPGYLPWNQFPSCQ